MYTYAYTYTYTYTYFPYACCLLPGRSDALAGLLGDELFFLFNSFFCYFFVFWCFLLYCFFVISVFMFIFNYLLFTSFKHISFWRLGEELEVHGVFVQTQHI